MELRDACALTNLLHTHAHTHTFLKLILNFKKKVLMFCVTFRQITLFSLPLRTSFTCLSKLPFWNHQGLFKGYLKRPFSLYLYVNSSIVLERFMNARLSK